MDDIVKKYRPDLLEPPAPQEENGASGGQEQQMTEKNEPSSARQQDKEKQRGGGAALQTAPRNFIRFAENSRQKIPPTSRGNCGLLVTGGTFHYAGCSELPT